MNALHFSVLHLLNLIDENSSDEMEEDSLVSKLQDSVESADELITAQIKTLEILTNICCSGDDDSDEFYEDESISDESLGNEGYQEGIIDLHPELKKAFIDAQLFQLVIEKTKLPATNVIEALNQHRLGWYLTVFDFIPFLMADKNIFTYFREIPC